MLRPRSALLVAATFALAATPHLPRLAHPSIFGDDVPRVAALQTQTLWEVASTPFNEHMSPLFDAVTWAGWRLAGRDLTRVAASLTVLALVPFGLCIGMLWTLLRRDWGPAVAAIGALVFASSRAFVVEAAWWYSGSNHMWALLATLVALWGAGRGGVVGNLLAFAGAMLAPAFSAMGFLAMPAAMLGSLGRGKWPSAVAPILGLAAYFGACGLIDRLADRPDDYAAILARSARENTRDWAAGLQAAADAPALVLVPSLVGLRNLDMIFSRWVGPLLAAVAAVGLLIWSAVDRRRRPAIWSGLALMGAYAMIYPFRSVMGAENLLRVARYHLFPAAGLILIGSSALGAWPRFRRLDGRAPTVALVASAALLALHGRHLVAQSAFYDFPEQRPTLAALERLADLCRREGIGREQVLRNLEPIQPRWDPQEGVDAHRLLPETVWEPEVADTEVRGRLLAHTPIADREALFGGMDAGPLLVPAYTLEGRKVAAEGRLVGADRVAEIGPGRYEVGGYPCDLEYEFVGDRAGAAYLVVPARAAAGGVEVRWSAEGLGWSAARSVRWRVDPSRPGLAWAVPLSGLPHWDVSRAGRLRVGFRYPGAVEAGPPRLAR